MDADGIHILFTLILYDFNVEIIDLNIILVGFWKKNINFSIIRNLEKSSLQTMIKCV